MNPLLLAGLAYIALSSNRSSGESSANTNQRQQPEQTKSKDPTVQDWIDYLAKVGGAVADVVNAAKR